MRPQHLSDEAVAAFADGALSGVARQRASQHTADCPECAYAVAVQREAAWALRAAPAPALPSGLLDRLREVPVTTPLTLTPTALGSDGSTLLSTFGALSAPAAIVPVPPGPSGEHPHRLRPIVGAAVAVAAAGVLAISSAAHASSPTEPLPPRPAQTGAHAHVQPAVFAPAEVGPAGTHR